MKKLFDFDGMFDKKLAQYMRENGKKHSEKEWESLIPKLYHKFGDTFIKSANATPRGYYAAMDDKELVETLAAHIKEDVPVPDFLCREIEGRNCPKELVALINGEGLDGEKEKQLVTCAINLAGASPAAFESYLALIAGDFDKEIKDAAADMLKAGADKVKVRALELYEKGIEREYMLEILSRTKERDERVFEILLKEFRASGEDELPMHASYLAAYGDERALPVLLEFIDRDEINYLEFQELRYAIEALGGEYTRERDFSEDKYYQEIMEQSSIPPEFNKEQGQNKGE